MMVMATAAVAGGPVVTEAAVTVESHQAAVTENHQAAVMVGVAVVTVKVKITMEAVMTLTNVAVAYVHYVLFLLSSTSHLLGQIYKKL